MLKGNSSVQFNNNVAKFGGALYIETNSGFTITESPLVILSSNKAESREAVNFKNGTGEMI